MGPARDTLDACLIFPSMPAVMKLNKLGSFSMSQVGAVAGTAAPQPAVVALQASLRRRCGRRCNRLMALRLEQRLLQDAAPLFGCFPPGPLART